MFSSSCTDVEATLLLAMASTMFPKSIHMLRFKECILMTQHGAKEAQLNDSIRSGP
jgi:hypothetical protein